MSLSGSRTLFRSCNFIVSLSKPVKWNPTYFTKNCAIRVLSSGICYKNTYSVRPFGDVKRIDFITIRQCTTQGGTGSDKTPPETTEKKGFKGLILKFKEMYRDYWYVLLPVHMATSAVWFGGFYYAVHR